MRAFSFSDIGAIKAATARAYHAVGGVSRAAGLLGVGSSTLTKYASSDAEWTDRVIRVDLGIRLDRAAGHPFLLSAYERLVRAPAPDAAHGAMNGAMTGQAITASAVLRLNTILDDVVREVATAIEDCRVDGAEKLAIRKRIVLAQQELARLDAAVS